MYSVFLSSYRNTRESLGELEKAPWKQNVATQFVITKDRDIKQANLVELSAFSWNVCMYKGRVYYSFHRTR